MQVLVATSNHKLMPLAWRLKNEKNDVEVILRHQGYKNCWRGKFKTHRISKKDADSNNGMQFSIIEELARDHGALVLSDIPQWHDGLSKYPTVFSTLASDPEDFPWMVLGAWFDGQDFHAKHILFYDLGAWTGGQGPNVPGALTMVKPNGWAPSFDDCLATAKEKLVMEDFRGLVQVAIDFDPARKSYVFSGYKAGWHQLHMQAFMADQEMTPILTGQVAPKIAKRFTVCVAITVWPYPMGTKVTQNNKNYAKLRTDGQVISGLDQEQSNRIFFHDIFVDETKSNKIISADTDGFVGVSYGSANNISLARHQALKTADDIKLVGKQFRADAGCQVEPTLASLENDGIDV